MPLEAGHTPTKILAKVDLPEPDGPAIDKKLPAGICKLRPRKIGTFDPGAPDTTFSTITNPFGVGKAMVSEDSGMPAKSPLRRK